MNTTTPDDVLPSGAQWTIRAHGYAATIVEFGGGLRHLTYDGRDLVHGYADDEMADAARGHVLAPWPNRIDGGEYTFEGVDHVLPLTEPGLGNASHGLVRWVPWRLVDHSDATVTVSCRVHPQPGWSWTLDLSLTYTLDAGGLTVTPRATNRSATPCPFGFGMHPYLTAGETTLDDVTLTLPARTRIDVDDRLIPTGRTPLEPGDAAEFAAGRSLRGVGLDTCFTDLAFGEPQERVDGADSPGMVDDGPHSDERNNERIRPDGSWRVSLSAGERTTTLWADADAYPYVQLFTGDGLPEPKRRRSGVAVEPMTCPADAFNSGESLIVLAPGETWSAPFGISSSRASTAPRDRAPSERS